MLSLWLGVAGVSQMPPGPHHTSFLGQIPAPIAGSLQQRGYALIPDHQLPPIAGEPLFQQLASHSWGRPLELRIGNREVMTPRDTGFPRLPSAVYTHFRAMDDLLNPRDELILVHLVKVMLASSRVGYTDWHRDGSSAWTATRTICGPGTVCAPEATDIHHLGEQRIQPHKVP